MSKINVLDRHTAELIAAGEVVERPASAIKEMVENSIDSGADAITVEIKNGGNTFMRVTDNGCGIENDDIRNAFLRHATSKIKTKEDLDNIGTLGFRGEALASISAVSKVELLTRVRDSEFGTKYVINGGEEVEFEQAGTAEGTTIVVRDLFYNTPARRKFLKKDTTESNVVTAMIERMAISHPEISFKLIRDSKQVLNTPGDNNLHSAIFTVFGKEFANSLLPVDYELGGVKVHGFVCKPTSSRKNRAMQFMFLNGRYIRTKTGIAALEQAYKNSIMVGTYPSCVLHLSIDFSLVDVNVHPAKIEVRFSNEQSIFNAVYYAVKSALSADDSRVAFESREILTTPSYQKGEQLKFNTPSAKLQQQRIGFEKKIINGGFEKKNEKSSENDVKINVSKTYDFVSDNDKNDKHLADSDFPTYAQTVRPQINIPNVIITDKPIENIVTAPEKTQTVADDVVNNEAGGSGKNDDLLNSVEDDNNANAFKAHIDFKYIGEAFDTYIIVEVGRKLIMIDKHAAHERILFEKFKQTADYRPQMLLVPVNVTLSAAEYEAITDNLERINKFGFEVDDFGMNTVRVRAVPVYLDGEDVSGLIEEIAGKLINKNTDFTPEFLEWLFHSVACRAAIKAGNHSTKQELCSLADIVLNDDKIRYCPHGRPVAAELSDNEIKKRFSRI